MPSQQDIADAVCVLLNAGVPADDLFALLADVPDFECSLAPDERTVN